MKFYTPHFVPESVYLIEAVYWVALGRLPEYVPDDDGQDVRGDIDRHEEYFNAHDEGLFSEDEFLGIGHKIDAVRYFDTAYDEPGFRDQQEMLKYFESVPVGIGLKEQPTDQDIEDVAYVESCNRLFNPMIERAKVTIIGDLMSDTLSARGLLVSKDWEPDWSACNPDLPEASSIPNDAWNLDGINWQESTLRDGASKYLLACLSFEEVVGRYPAPLIGSTDLNAERFGATVLVHDDNPANAAKAKRRRGRPPKATGSIRSVVRNVFAQKIKRGDIPEKHEALYQDVMEFVATAFGEGISRSTAQNYVRDLLPNPARK